MHWMQRELAWVPRDWWGIFQHFQFCFTFLLMIKCCSCFLSNCNVPVSLVLLYSPQQSRCSSHAPTSCLLEITFSGFPMFFPKDWDTFSSLLFLSYHMCFPHTFSKFATKTVQNVQHSNNLCAVIPGTAMETQELLEKFSGNSWLLTCSLGHTTWSCYHNALSPISLGQKVNCNSLFLSTDHRSILNKFPFLFNMIILFGDGFQTWFKKCFGMKNAAVYIIQNVY